MAEIKKGDTVVTVGTRKGLFLLHSKDRRAWRTTGPFFEGLQVNHAVLDPRDGKSLWAGVTSMHWGPTVQRSTSFGARWEKHPTQPAFPKPSGLAVKAIWHVEPGSDGELWCGVEPAGLFRSVDQGKTWESVDGLNLMAKRDTWAPGGGGLCLHTILPDPRDARRMVVAISAVGVMETRDGGVTWHTRNGGVRADFLPAGKTAEHEWGSCPHKLCRDPKNAGRILMQNHCGFFERGEDDRAWREAGRGLPSRFGFPLAMDADGRAFAVPLQGDFNRTTPGAFSVHRREGRTWTKLTKGLPAKGAWMTVLREGLATDADDGVYVGTTTGQVYATRNGGNSWTTLAEHLPPVCSIEAGVAGRPRSEH